MRCFPAIFLLLSLATTTLVASPAYAQRKADANAQSIAEAKRLFDEGAELYGKGDYEAAIERWEISFELSKKPLIYESIANAYERLGNAKKAREYLAKWRENAPDDERPRLDDRIANLDARIQKEDAAAAAKQNGAVVKPADDNGPTMQTAVGFGLVGAGAGALATGVTLALIGVGQRPDPAEVCKNSGDRSVCMDSARADIDGSSSLTTAGDVVGALGLAMVAAGVVLVLIDEEVVTGEVKTGSAQLSPALAPGRAALMFGGTF